MHNYTILSILILSIMSLTIMTGIAYAHYAEYIQSPKKQIDSGINPYDVICRNGLLLAERSSNMIACVNQIAADKLGWKIIKIDFSANDANTTNTSENTTNTSENTTNTSENTTNTSENTTNTSENTTNSKTTTPAENNTVSKQNYGKLDFALASNVTYSGKEYGYYEPNALRRPPPYPMSDVFGLEHYDMRQATQNSPQFNSGQINTSSLTEKLIQSNLTHKNSIDYTRWIPTIIPDGYDLLWVDIRQPEVYNNDVGQLDLHYIINTVEVSNDILTRDFYDIAMFQITVVLYPYRDEPASQERIDWITRNGTATHVFYEEKYGGIFETLLESPADSNVRGVEWSGHEYQISIGGRGLSVAEYEKILVNILERQ